MQTHWSTGSSEGDGGPVDDADEVSTGAAAGATPGVGFPADDAGSGSPADATEGEEEAHRSAVDAVDALLDEVELALARLDDGTYGRCEACGAPIDDARLADTPIERTCGTCVAGGTGGAGAVSGATAATGAADATTGSAVAPAGFPAAAGHHGG
jgi:DnaK suppressor protein